MLDKAKLCPSVYLSSFEKQKDRLAQNKKQGAPIFTSLHISEEIAQGFEQRAAEMCGFLKEHGYTIISDMSRRLLEVFPGDTVWDIAKELSVDVFRLDYGFTEQETIDIVRHMPVALNASSMSAREIGRIAAHGDVIAIHNFYPRPETGLDEDVIDRLNRELKSVGVPVFAFIPSDLMKRGTLFEGLPTVEKHRRKPPLVNFCDMMLLRDVDGVFVGDGFVTQTQEALIGRFTQSGAVPIPVKVSQEYKNLLDRVLTVRGESPHAFIRILESREYSSVGERVEPEEPNNRYRGTITIDNLLYKRYSGEVQIIRRDLPADERVNVIGRVHPEYVDLLDYLGGSAKFVLINEQEVN